MVFFFPSIYSIDSYFMGTPVVNSPVCSDLTVHHVVRGKNGEMGEKMGGE